jgi:hypothetical protein
MNRTIQLSLVAFLCLAPQELRGADQRRSIAPSDTSRAIALETTRQDMIQTRLDDLLGRFQQLAADLHSNPAVGADAEAGAAGLEARLRAIKNGRLAEARDALGRAMRNPATAPAHVGAARAAIDRAARELASLLLRAGMSPAAEVFAREIRELIDQQEPIQRETLAAADPPAAAAGPPSALPDGDVPLGAAQKVLADRLARLLAEIAALPDTQTDALTAVRIIRTRKLIEAGGAAAALLAAAADLDRKAPAPAVPRQTQALTVLRQAEVKLRAEAGLQTMVQTRNMLQEMLAGQKGLRTRIAVLDASEFSPQRPVLERRQRGLLQRLVQIDTGLGLSAQLQTAAKSAADAAARLGTGDRAGVITAEEQLETILTQMIKMLQQRIDDFRGLSTAYRCLQDASSRLKNLQDITERHGQAAENARSAMERKKELAGVAALEQRLAEEITRFAGNLPADSKWTGILRRPLSAAARATAAAATALKDRKPEKLEAQLVAASSALSEALECAKKEVDFLDKTWTLRQLAGDLKEISRWLADIEDEQRDLRALAEAKAGAKPARDLAATQDMLVHALAEADQMVSAIAEAAPMGPNLVQAAQAMSSALAQLREGRPEMAVPLAAKAEEELQKARKFAANLAARAEYLAQWVAAMEMISANSADLLQRQILLRKRTESAELTEFAEISGEQDVLKAETSVFCDAPIESAATAFRTAAREMGLAIEQLDGRHRDPAVAHQLLAEKALRAAIEEIQRALAAIMHAMSTTADLQAFNGLDPLQTLLFLAVREKDLCDATHAAPEIASLPELAPTQVDIRKEAADLVEIPTIQMAADNIRNAMGEMDKVIPLLKQPVRQPAIEHERSAEKYLRMAFAQVVLAMWKAALADARSTESEDKTGGPPDPTAIPFNSFDHWETFLKSDPAGADVNRDKAQWESLINRDRAALNENFARELPLEYRQLLKEYYEALSK